MPYINVIIDDEEVLFEGTETGTDKQGSSEIYKERAGKIGKVYLDKQP